MDLSQALSQIAASFASKLLISLATDLLRTREERMGVAAMAKESAVSALSEFNSEQGCKKG